MCDRETLRVDVWIGHTVARARLDDRSEVRCVRDDVPVSLLIAVLGESVTIIGSPDALPGTCPLLAFDDTLRVAEVPPLRFSPF